VIELIPKDLKTDIDTDVSLELYYEFDPEDSDLDAWMNLSILDGCVIVEITKNHNVSIWTERYGAEFVNYDRSEWLSIENLEQIVGSRFYCIHKAALRMTIEQIIAESLKSKFKD